VLGEVLDVGDVVGLVRCLERRGQEAPGERVDAGDDDDHERGAARAATREAHQQPHGEPDAHGEQQEDGNAAPRAAEVPARAPDPLRDHRQDRDQALAAGAVVGHRNRPGRDLAVELEPALVARAEYERGVTRVLVQADLTNDVVLQRARQREARGPGTDRAGGGAGDDPLRRAALQLQRHAGAARAVLERDLDRARVLRHDRGLAERLVGRDLRDHPGREGRVGAGAPRLLVEQRRRHEHGEQHRRDRGSEDGQHERAPAASRAVLAGRWRLRAVRVGAEGLGYGHRRRVSLAAGVTGLALP
jgi:hypothetical protein